ncbi:uncharacterized protein IL334_003989 [Kwoniella shivajii]|uniref:Uncharacterized protein n=1 Tax=Kwoniella shivajii TaxID=564305 RepID=A0ABZ1CZ69_9TREE|nr:hypothetical protein IL334_003989 [Kwoniella shivajii]
MDLDDGEQSDRSRIPRIETSYNTRTMSKSKQSGDIGITQEDILSKISKSHNNGSGPSKIGFIEGEQEQGVVGDMLRRIYDFE